MSKDKSINKNINENKTGIENLTKGEFSDRIEKMVEHYLKMPDNSHYLKSSDNENQKTTINLKNKSITCCLHCGAMVFSEYCNPLDNNSKISAFHCYNCGCSFIKDESNGRVFFLNEQWRMKDE